MLQVGDPVPDFALASDTAGTVKASELRGQRYVLYFYPRDDTPGCTAEACNFRDNLPNFGSLNVPVYGISPDDVKSHTRFRAKFGLTFPLLADPEHTTAEAFGAWVEKNMYGRTYMGVQRSTFIVGPGGRVERVWEKVNPANHANEVLAYLRNTPSPAAEAPRAIEAEPAGVQEEPAEYTPEPPTQANVRGKPAVKRARAMKASTRTARKGGIKTAAAKKTAAKKGATKKGAAKKAAKR